MSHAWMPFYVADYLADTGHLTALEHGAYMLMILHYWQNGGLPENERLIARVARLTPAEWAESRDVLAALFVDGWRHKRIDAELTKADEIVEKRRSSANARHQGSKSNAHAVQVDSTCSDAGVPTFNQEPTSETSSEVKRVPRDELLDVLDAEHAGAVIEHRQRLRKPLSVRAAKLLAASLAKFPEPNAAADRMIEKGWASIDIGWDQKQQAPPGKPKPITQATMWHEEARNHGIIDDPPNTANGRLVEGQPRGQNQGPGLARRIASA